MNALYWLLLPLMTFIVSSAIADTTYDFCKDEDNYELCPTLPQDLSEEAADSTYSFINIPSQMPFDRFGWRTLVALNWPVLGNNLERKPWEDFVNSDDLFPPNKELKCTPEPGQIHVWRYFQTSGQPLIDRDGNYVVYATHLNEAMADQIKREKLYLKSGQVEQSEISFQSGLHNDHQQVEAAMMMKTAWRILPEDSADNTRFLVRNGLLEILPSNSFNGDRLCLSVNLGLVGQHNVHKTATGFGDHWVWSTYEHIDNVPLAANARRIEKVYEDVDNKPLSENARRTETALTLTPFKNGCLPPKKVDRHYNFHPPKSVLEQHETEGWKWNSKPPYAVSSSGKLISPNRIVRCWEIYEGTQETNRIWQEKLAGTVWENYMLVSTQWRGDLHDDPILGLGELPRYLANTAIETFIQENTSCMSCHKAARDALGRFSDFTFLLHNAK